MTTITSNFETVCHRCREAMPAKTPIVFDTRLQKAFHPACYQKTVRGRAFYGRGGRAASVSQHTGRSTDEMHDIYASGYGARYGSGDLD